MDRQRPFDTTLEQELRADELSETLMSAVDRETLYAAMDVETLSVGITQFLLCLKQCGPEISATLDSYLIALLQETYGG